MFFLDGCHRIIKVDILTFQNTDCDICEVFSLVDEVAVATVVVVVVLGYTVQTL